MDVINLTIYVKIIPFFLIFEEMGQFCPSLINNNNSTKFIIGFWCILIRLVLCIWPNLCLIYTLLWFISMLDIFVLYLELSQYTFMVCFYAYSICGWINHGALLLFSVYLIFSLVVVLLWYCWECVEYYIQSTFVNISDCLSVKQMETFFAQVAYVHLDIVNRHLPINHLNHHIGHPNIAFT